MSQAIAAQKQPARAAKKKPAARKPAHRPEAAGPMIDAMLERVRTRGVALSADIKNLLTRIG